MTIDLAKNAMLVSLTISQAGLLGERRDNAASELVESTYSVAHKRAKASKFLINRRHDAVKRVVAAAQSCREVFYRYTVPWGDDKSRVLAVKARDDFDREIKVALHNLNQSWDEYSIVFPTLVAQSERDLGGLFDSGQYPSGHKVRGMFAASVTYWPFPTSGNFVADVADSVAASVKAEIEAETDNRIEAALSDIVSRIRDTVSTYVDKLNSYKTEKTSDGKEKVIGIFRDTLVTNCDDLAGLVEKLNITENPEVIHLASQLRRLSAVTAEALRVDPNLRAGKVAEGRALLNRLAALDQVDNEVSTIMGDVGDYLG